MCIAAVSSQHICVPTSCLQNDDILQIAGSYSIFIEAEQYFTLKATLEDVTDRGQAIYAKPF